MQSNILLAGVSFTLRGMLVRNAQPAIPHPFYFLSKNTYRMVNAASGRVYKLLVQSEYSWRFLSPLLAEVIC